VGPILAAAYDVNDQFTILWLQGDGSSIDIGRSKPAW
jgi:hypothetical protein